ncbi:MAG: hypothetical protein ACI9VN_000302 [Patescibacteria group bacterium]|jgi:hypothetical protein
MKKYASLLFFSLFFIYLLSAQRTIGLFQNDLESFDGYTLFAANGYTSTYLIDNCGRLINEWPGNYRPGSVNYLLEDGHLYRAVRNPGGPFFGGGIGGEIEKLDWEGNIVWSYNYGTNDYHQHHDIEVLPNGNVLILAWELKTNEEAINAGRDPDQLEGDLWPEHIVEVEPVGINGGNIVWEWHLWDHLVQELDSQQDNYGEVEMHPELLDINFKGFSSSFVQADWIHANAIDYNPQRDEIVLSSRHLSEFWVIDHSTTAEEAASHSGGNAGKGGDFLYRWGNAISYKRASAGDKKLFGQHDVHWIPEGLPDAGKIMVFNNGLNRPMGNTASVDVIQPPLDANGNYILVNEEPYGPEDLYWTYYPGSTDFYSSTVSGAQRMPNGNTLICEGNKGHFFEIMSDGTKVWKYINPVGSGGPAPQETDPSSNGVFRAYRYAADFPAFFGKDLTPGKVIELNPLPTVCDTITATNDINEVEWSFFPNPVDEVLHIRTTQNKIGRLKLVDVLGRVMWQQEITESLYNVPTINLQEGVYFLVSPKNETRKVICKH